MGRTRKVGIASLVTAALLLPVAPTSAGDSYQGKWRGKTDDDERIVFKINPKGQLKRFRANYTVFAGDLCRRVDLKLNMRDIKVPIEDDAFKFKYEKKKDGREIFVKIKGAFDSAEKAAGKLKATFQVISYGVIDCFGFETITWKAHKL